MKHLERIIIIGLIAILGIGIYFSTKDFFHKIEKEEIPIVEKIEKENIMETLSPQEPIKVEEQKEEKKETIKSQKQEIKPAEETYKSELVSLGIYKITAYCACEKCCGKTNGITASGTKVQAGRTIAAPKNFPFGTKLVINGHTYTVEDRGGAIQGNRIDIYFDTHEEALQWGVKYLEVFKVVE